MNHARAQRAPYDCAAVGVGCVFLVLVLRLLLRLLLDVVIRLLLALALRIPIRNPLIRILNLFIRLFIRLPLFPRLYRRAAHSFARYAKEVKVAQRRRRRVARQAVDLYLVVSHCFVEKRLLQAPHSYFTLP